jgi:hypothetical protein
MRWDLVRGRCVVHGGFAGLGPDPDTWEYDGNTWILAAQRGPLSVHGSMVFDAAAGGCVLHDPGVPFGPFLPRTHVWNGTIWQSLAVARTGAGWTLSFDLARNQIVSVAGPRVFAATTGPAATSVYGSGCSGSGSTLQLDAGQRPVLGSRNCTLEIGAAPPTALCAMFADFAPANTAIGAGCTVLLAEPAGVGFAFSDGAGIASFAFPVPDACGLLGLRVFAQGAALDPAGAFGAATTSNGLELHLGR